MKKLLCSALFLALFTAASPAEARSRTKTPSGNEAQVLQQFEQILDLWRDGKYVELYEHTEYGKESKERFAQRLASAPRRPACCWEKIQDPRVTLKGNTATVHARLGFEGDVAGTSFVTKAIRLKNENGVWLISQNELFTLGNLVKKRTRTRWVPANQ